MIRQLGQYFQDSAGRFSSMRFALLLWAIGAFVVWATISITTMTVQPFAVELSMTISALAAAKSVQVFAENKNANNQKLQVQKIVKKEPTKEIVKSTDKSA